MINPATVQLILLALTLADKLIFNIGGKIIEISTKDFTNPDDIAKAFQAAAAEGFPDFEFKNPVQ